MILRFIIAREWKLDSICKEIYSHLEWREINIPLPILNPQTLNCLKAGALYIHGRCKDLTPILVANMGVVGRLFEKDQICAESFVQLHNLLANYITANMLVPGQVDRWIVLGDASQFSLLKLPIGIFKQANREMTNNYLENSHKFLVVNMTWFQSSLLKTF